eukprot:TRINITY_DN4326_c0_g1_i2.p1 TRINITY_DN4326_c0_g1~~TRINITY_DN4326_c0_g1_i2.p1  ORF type:complete len:223 (+),score=43.00 TRINITY_DN4326_c0_g1_i2:676-1344(+)
MDTEEIIRDFLAEGEDVWSSHFGRIEDLRTDNTTNQNTDQLGYTNFEVAPHTDMPFIENPPSIQLLHGIQAAEEGGQSYLVDSLAASLYLKSINLNAFDMLTTVPVKFHRRQKNFEALTNFPMIQCSGDTIERVRYSYFTLAPFSHSFGQMRAWYESYNSFAKIIYNKQHQYRFLLGGGDFVLYSNNRMMHAREAFKGPRWVRGVYFYEEQVLAHLRNVIDE